MEHCVAGKEKYLAFGCGLFGRGARKNPFEAPTMGGFCIFFASQLMHGLKRANGIKRYSMDAQSAVDFEAVLDAVDVESSRLVVDPVKNTVIVDPDTVTFITSQLDSPMWAGIGR